jgi:tripartite-type tricarboxylate transporter receptor subunit TctC
MFQRSIKFAAVFLLACGLSIGSASAQSAAEFPTKPIRLVLPFAPGGLIDITARMLSEEMRQILGQPVVLEYKPGGSGVVAFNDVIRQPADGYTLTIGVNTTNLFNPIIRAHEMPFDIRKVLTPITGLVEAPQLFLATSVNFPPNSFKEFIEHAKKNPGKYNHTVVGMGSNSHFDFLVMQRRYGFSIVTVPARAGAATAQVDLINGDVQVAMMNAATYTPIVQSGRLRAFAISGAERSPHLPEVPTLKELGFEDIGIGTWTVVFAPAGTPAPILEKIRSAFAKALDTPKVKEQMAKLSLTKFLHPSADAAKQWLDGEFDKWSKVAEEFREELKMPPKKSN